MLIWDESPGFKSQMHKKSGEKKEFKKPPEKGTGIPHSDMRWLVTDVRGRRDNSNNGKDLWTLINWNAQIWAVAVSDKESFTGATEVKRLSVRFNKRVLKVNSDEVDKCCIEIVLYWNSLREFVVIKQVRNSA